MHTPDNPSRPLDEGIFLHQRCWFEGKYKPATFKPTSSKFILIPVSFPTRINIVGAVTFECILHLSGTDGFPVPEGLFHHSSVTLLHSVIPGLPAICVDPQLAQAPGGLDVCLQILIAVCPGITCPARFLHQIR